MNKAAIRAGCKDIWNSFMLEDATFGRFDIPYCPTTSISVPEAQVTWEEAKMIHKAHIAKGEKDYKVNKYINWYIDDYKFDGPHGIWQNSETTLNVIRHFAGIITPDFSTYQDFPEAIKIYAVYRMRTYGYWLGKQGIAVINNVRWGTEESYNYCFEGIPYHSIVSIGTVGGGPRKLADRDRFESGLNKLSEILNPHTILVYGSANGQCFDRIREKGIRVISYSSRTALFFEGRKSHE